MYQPERQNNRLTLLVAAFLVLGMLMAVFLTVINHIG